MASEVMNSSGDLSIIIDGIRNKVLTHLRRPVVYHSLFWILYFIFNVFRWGSYSHNYLNAFYQNLIEFPLHIAVAYLNIYYLIPKLLPKKVFHYVTFITLGVLFAVGGRLVLETFFQLDPANTSYYYYVGELLIGEVYVQGFITALKFLFDWGKSQNHLRKLEKINFETELDFLRSQVQPHFFFNTLNNLYSLTLDKSDLAPDTILKLSELMSYVIYDGKQKKVHLSKEIAYIQNYLDLEKLRFGNKLNVKLDIKGQVNNQEIVPLLLLPFIENSFKHGVGNGINEIKIYIGLEIKPNQVIFTAQNQKYERINALAPNSYHHMEHNGIGVENIKRRLELIYEKNYNLEIKDEQDKYTVTLKIPTYENTLSDSR